MQVINQPEIKGHASWEMPPREAKPNNAPMKMINCEENFPSFVCSGSKENGEREKRWRDNISGVVFFPLEREFPRLPCKKRSKYPKAPQRLWTQWNQRAVSHKTENRLRGTKWTWIHCEARTKSSGKWRGLFPQKSNEVSLCLRNDVVFNFREKNGIVSRFVYRLG